MDDTSPTSDAPFTLTPQAVDRIATLLAEDTEAGGRDAEKVFRVAILGGGCSGFQYSFAIEAIGSIAADDDRLLDFTATDGTAIKVVVDSLSLGMLAGCALDFITEMIGSYFRVHNPNATASCGCGTSFAI